MLFQDNVRKIVEDSAIDEDDNIVHKIRLVTTL